MATSTSCRLQADWSIFCRLFSFLRLFCPRSCFIMQEEMEMKSGSAVRSVPAGSGNDAYESVTLRQKQQLEVNIQRSIDLGKL